MIGDIISGLSLVANVVLIWTIICDKDDIEQLEYENEKLTLAIDKLLYDSDRGRNKRFCSEDISLIENYDLDDYQKLEKVNTGNLLMEKLNKKENKNVRINEEA